ncbi:MAG: acyl carrier protein [Candidatus Omnitrophica bacterium]|nr:acyl carrier protein [Candidatus Omnitrophota bacterium]
MDQQEIIKKLNGIFCQVFDDDSLVISETTSASSIPEWDSLGHITLILAVEKLFKMRFTTAEIAEMKKPGQNVGSFSKMILAKSGASAA